MQLETLKMFCDVVTSRSFSKAAAENGVTQSTVSQAVQRLEEYFNVTLIDRSVRPWQLTKEGGICFERFREISESLYSLREEVGHSKEVQSRKIRVSTIYSVAFTHFGHIHREFSRRHPNDNLIVEHEHPAVICEKVATKELDFGIVSFPPERRDLQITPWLNEEMVVVCAPIHRLSRFSSLRVEDLNGVSLVSFDQDLVIGKRIYQFLRKHQVQFSIALRFDNIEAIKRAVETSNYIAILPRITVERESTTGLLKVIEINNAKIERPLGILHRPESEMSPFAKRFLKILLDYAENSRV